MTLSLRYPDDRVNGFVQLTDGSGGMYVPDFIRSYDTGTEAGNAMRYAGAFLALARRVATANRIEDVQTSGRSRP